MTAAECFACGRLAVTVTRDSQHCGCCGFAWYAVARAASPATAKGRGAPVTSRTHRAQPMSLPLRELASVVRASVAPHGKPLLRARRSATMLQSMPPE